MNQHRIVFLNGDFVPEIDAKISVFDRGFMFSDGIYEVVRFYKGALFANDLHLKRLERSLREMALPANRVDWTSVFNELITKNHLTTTDGIVYLQITRGVADRDHPFPSEEMIPTMFAYAKAFARPVEKLRNGVKVITMPDIRWGRCDIKSVSLLANVFAQQKAKESGVQEAVLLKDNFITEGSRSNIFMVKDGVVFTHPKSTTILPGTERDLVLTLCQENAISITEEAFSLLDFQQADEAFITSTTSEVMPIIEVDGITVGEGTPGVVTQKLQRYLEKLITSI